MKALRLLFQASIARTLLGGFLLVIVPTMALGLISNAAGIRVASREISSSYANSIALLSQQMADKLYNMDMLAASVLLDDDLVAISNSEMGYGDLFDYVLFQKRMLLYRTPQFIDANIVVCLPRQGWAISTNTGVMKTAGMRERAGAAAAQTGGAAWAIRESLVSPDADCLSVFRGYVHGGQSSPFIIMEISRGEMEKALETLTDSTRVLHTFFLDPIGGYFSSGNELHEDLAQRVRESLSGAQAGAQAGGLPSGLPGSSGESAQSAISFGGKTYRLLYRAVGNYGSKIGMLFDESDILRPVVNIRAIFVAFMIFTVSASLLFLFIAYRKIFAPVRSLMGAMLAVESGDLGARAEIERGNELSVMSRQFNSMVGRLDALISESYVKELKLKNAQLRFLRSQINPHFLYNSLFSLYSMIQNGELESASDMAVYLGKYYQRGARLSERELTIAEEVENIRTYVRIMAIRFPERLRLETKIGGRTGGLKIPALSLQTIAENAVLHGMEGAGGECAITVETWTEGKALRLRVSDTGAGISPARLESIRERLSRPAEIGDGGGDGDEDRRGDGDGDGRGGGSRDGDGDGSAGGRGGEFGGKLGDGRKGGFGDKLGDGLGGGHGLENVCARLKLMYGDGVAMGVSDNFPAGTTVDIRIPLKGEDADVQPASC
ncbi:MAG: histidine kinase [Clostridiales bacterium]|nr:histidine kinase [Clostridiales bacterium]